jgi:hypothetical protein
MSLVEYGSPSSIDYVAGLWITGLPRYVSGMIRRMSDVSLKEDLTKRSPSSSEWNFQSLLAQKGIRTRASEFW